MEVDFKIKNGFAKLLAASNLLELCKLVKKVFFYLRLCELKSVIKMH